MKTKLLIILLLLSFSGFAQLRTANIFTSHMVLQRDKKVSVWGWANKNETIKLQFNGQIISAKANAQGKWMITLSPMKAGGPFVMRISSLKENVVLDDVMIGEVWICSGQSNMEFRVEGVQNAQDEMENADSSIRQFKVANQVSLRPENDITKGGWIIANIATVKDFTAVGYFFAKELSQKLHVTIGLINDNWGGSQIESWLSKDAMQTDDELKDYAQHLPQTWQAADSMMFTRTEKKISLAESKINISNVTAFDKWLPYNAPGQWDWQGIWAFRGNGFMEKEVDIPANETSKISTINIGENDGHFKLYINGKFIKEGEGKDAHSISLSSNTFIKGGNIIVVEQAQQKDPGWFGMGFYGDANKLSIIFNDLSIPLSGEGWRILPDINSSYSFMHGANNFSTSIYNAMIHPIIPYTIRGVIWYQGESNAERAFQYRKTFPLLINSWRKEWRDTFPFLFVQLSSFGKQQSSNEGSDWAELREAQTMTLLLPKTGMAVTTDIGNPDDIHPKDKQDVGKRLAASALYNVYTMDILPSGPMYKSVSFENNKAIINFNFIGKGLMAKDKYGYLKGFEIAGEDKKFYYAKATIENDNVVVWNENVLKPIAVRYAWSDAPIDANLYNQDGLPASSFRTDDWKGITVDKKFNE